MTLSAASIPEASADVGSIALIMPEDKRSSFNHQRFIMLAEKEITFTVWKLTPIRRNFIFDAPRTVRSVIENIDKITEIIEIDRPVSSRSTTQDLKIDHKTVLSQLRKVGFKKKLDVLVTHQLTAENMMDRISICEASAKRNEIGLFLNGW
ncbi:histone-lysine N-methyltransferase SETMAR [Trichonephila clavipes]|nr:histone-lysine N-methyltransferase SETMAR [Trichonephila clavipes]